MFNAEHDNNLADLEFTADEIAAGSRNPLLLLSASERQLNPRNFVASCVVKIMAYQCLTKKVCSHVLTC